MATITRQQAHRIGLITNQLVAIQTRDATGGLLLVLRIGKILLHLEIITSPDRAVAGSCQSCYCMHYDQGLVGEDLSICDRRWPSCSQHWPSLTLFYLLSFWIMNRVISS